MLSVCLPDQIADLLSVVGAAVGHGQQNTLNFQLRVDLPPNLLHGLQKLLQAFCRQVLCLHRNQSSVCRRQCVNGQHPQRWHTVQQNKIVLPLGAVQHLLEHLLPVHTVHEGYFQPCQFDVGRNQVNALCMLQNALAGLDGLVVHGFCHQGGEGGRQFVGLLPTHADGNVRMAGKYKSARSAHN